MADPSWNFSSEYGVEIFACNCYVILKRSSLFRGWLYGDFSSQDKVSTWFAELKFWRLYGNFHPRMNILKKDQLVENKWNFLFSSQDETKVTIIWRKMMFHLGIKVSSRVQLAGMEFHPGFLHVIVICFLYWKQWQGEKKFELGCVIVISSQDKIFQIINLSAEMKFQLGLTSWNFNPDWKSPYNRSLSGISLLIVWILNWGCKL